MRWRIVLLAVVVLIGVVAGAVIFGGVRWRSATNSLHSEIEANRAIVDPQVHDRAELEGLPHAVQRYLRAALSEDQALVAGVVMEHAGSFNMSEEGERWRSFTSTQRVVSKRPGFVWNARIRMAPGMTVRVHDAYVAGRGVLEARLFGLVTVMEQQPSPELAQGELMRFLAEATWYPTVLLPSQGVEWREIDDRRAAATLTDEGTTVELIFEFGADGLVRTVRSERRYRLVDGDQVGTPWEGRFWDYRRQSGMLIPQEGEVAWLVDGERRPYWRGTIETIEYELMTERQETSG
jgi:hypothetical protein